MNVIAGALKTTMPVMFGYVPLGMAFGVLFQNLGYPWFLAPLMGLFVYAGAAQFMAVGLLAAHAGLVEVAVSTFVLNSRHMFFGASVLGRYRAAGLRKLYLIFGLTDETYSLVTSTPVPDGLDPTRFYLAVTGLNQCYWVVGCTLGALAGSEFRFDSRGMEFALTALFVVLAIEQWRNVRRPFPFVIALVAGLLALGLVPRHMLMTALALTLAALLGRAWWREARP